MLIKNNLENMENLYLVKDTYQKIMLFKHSLSQQDFKKDRLFTLYVLDLRSEKDFLCPRSVNIEFGFFNASAVLACYAIIVSNKLLSFSGDGQKFSDLYYFLFFLDFLVFFQCGFWFLYHCFVIFFRWIVYMIKWHRVIDKFCHCVHCVRTVGWITFGKSVFLKCGSK